MKDKTFNLLYRVLNIWFAFIALLLVSNALPHWADMHFLGWINEIFYFLLFLLCVMIAVKDPSNKDVFINFSVLFFYSAFHFINIFMGKGYLFGDNRLAYYVLVYQRLYSDLLQNIVVVYIVSKYVYPKGKPVVLYALAFAITLPVFAYWFYPYLSDFDNFLKLGNMGMADLYSRKLSNGLLSLVFMFVFGYVLYKKDVALGEYLNAWMAFFFIFVFIGLVNDASRLFGFRLYNVSQYFLAIILVFLSAILIKKLIFLSTDYGQFYEKLLGGTYRLGNVQVQRRHFQPNAFVLKVLKIYIYQRLAYVITVFCLAVTVFLYFHFSKYVTLNVAAFFVCIIVLFNFINALYKKREKQRHVLTEMIKSDG